MSEKETQEKVKAIAREIIQDARSRLLVNLRCMDLALSQYRNLTWPGPLMTDGSHFLYDPKKILDAYQLDQNAITHDYLHMVLHGIYRHMYVNPSVDHELWDLACDIAVEAAIQDLNIKDAETIKANTSSSILKELSPMIPSFTAEKVYAWLQKRSFPEERIQQLRSVFGCDSHMIWYMSKEEASAITHEASDQNSRRKQEEEWARISDRMKTEMEVFGKKPGDQPGSFLQSLSEVHREKYDYTSFLRKFAVMREVMKLNPDEFDMNFYTYGISLYGNMPLIEPLEYREEKRIREFAIVIDTSGSVHGDLVQSFVQKTWNILKSTDSFDSRTNIHIIQCDADIQDDARITCQDDLDLWIHHMDLKGFGGTDFRPAFTYVNQLVKSHEFQNLRGLIYFTDGYGVYPEQKPAYETAFVFLDDDSSNDQDVPSWAMKLILSSKEIEQKD